MSVEIKEQNETFTAVLSGWIDTNVATQFLEDLKPLEAYADKIVVLDCGGIEYICSLGLRGLLKLKKESVAKGGDIVLSKVGGEFQKILTMTGFIKLFEIK